MQVWHFSSWISHLNSNIGPTCVWQHRPSVKFFLCLVHSNKTVYALLSMALRHRDVSASSYPLLVTAASEKLSLSFTGCLVSNLFGKWTRFTKNKRKTQNCLKAEKMQPYSPGLVSRCQLGLSRTKVSWNKLTDPAGRQQVTALPSARSFWSLLSLAL